MLCAFSQQAGKLLTISVLGAVGFFGHHFEWTLPGFATGKGGNADTTGSESPALSTGTDRNPLRVEFRSADAITRSGITTIPIEECAVSEEVSANGVIGYDQRLVARLAPRVAGTVWRVEKHWGDAVRQGDVLAIIEAADVGRVKAEFLTELVATDACVENLRLLEKIEASIPERQIRQARLTVREHRIRLLNAEQALVNLDLDVRIEDFQNLPDKERAALIHFAGLPAALAATFDPKNTTSNLIPIITPFDGVVIGRDVGLGEVVEPAKPLFQICDVRKMWINLQVQKEDAPKMSIGQEVVVKVDGMRGDLQSRISWISTEVNEETRTLQVRAEVDNPIVHPGEASAAGQRLLRANTFVTGTIRIRTSDQAIVVPSECVHADNQEHLVFIKTGERTFEGRRVRRGITAGNLTELIGDIAPGEIVAHRGSHLLKSQVLLSRSDSPAP